MKRIFSVVYILGILIIGGAGCSHLDDASSHKPNKPKVAATIFSLYDLVRIVGSDDIDVVLILPPGTSPHTYEPTPSILKSLQGSLRIFEIGHGLDRWAASIVESIPGASIVTADRDIKLRLTAELHEEEHEEGTDDEHGSFDPHYWMDPMNAVSMVDTIAEELSIIDPQHSEEFVTRAKEFKDELERKDREWRQLISGVENKKIVTFHDAFMYFADHFGFTVVATFEPFPGREPSPQYLIHLKEELEEHGVKTVYIEPQLAADSLQSFARDNNLRIGILDPEGSEDRTSYIEMIDYNVKTIMENQK